MGSQLTQRCVQGWCIDDVLLCDHVWLQTSSFLPGGPTHVKADQAELSERVLHRRMSNGHEKKAETGASPDRSPLSVLAAGLARDHKNTHLSSRGA